MTDHEIHLLRPEEDRAALDVFTGSLHLPRASDEDWQRHHEAWQPERGYGAFEGGQVIGTTRSFDATLRVPGERSVPMSAVSFVGVRADRTRRGVLSELMRTQLTDAARRGDVAATLRASEGVIYGRFGYGVATRAARWTVRKLRARVSESAQDGGQVELIDPIGEPQRLARAYDSLALAPAGAISRPSYWWAGYVGHLRREQGAMVAALHRSPSGVDGIATYGVTRTPGESPAVLRVDDMHVGSDAAFAGLWRFLLSVDLVDEVSVRARPVDDPLDLLLTDPRAAAVSAVRDETWLRLLDVPGALARRAYGPGRPVVIEVADRLLEANNGTYRISVDGVESTSGRPDLRMDVGALAALYLGDRTARSLAAAGRVQVLDAAALPEGDRLFTTLESPWCGTFF